MPPRPPRPGSRGRGCRPRRAPRDPAGAVPRSAASTTARCSNAARVVASDRARSASGPVRCTRHAAAAAWARSAVGGAGTDGTTGSGAVVPANRCSADRAGGACSRMTWALVPLMPNEDTAARRGPARLRPGAVLGEQLDRAGRPVDVGRRAVACRVRGSTPCRIARTILITPATPAAAWVCPMLDLTEPSHSGGPSARSWP